MTDSLLSSKTCSLDQVSSHINDSVFNPSNKEIYNIAILQVKATKTLEITGTYEFVTVKLVTKPSFDCLRVLDDNLTAVQMHRTQVKLNRPIAVGFAILELSKVAVYSFYYDFVKKKLAKNGSVSFLAGDSLVLKISGVEDLTNRYKVNKSLFDFSNLQA